jgi:probable DNA metabolism protein
MNIVLYDGSFEALLTAFFEIYEYKIAQPIICKEGSTSSSLFGTIHHVNFNEEKSNRVLEKLKEKLSPQSLSKLHTVYLSEIKDIENMLFRFVQYVLANTQPVENNLGHPDILLLHQTDKKVHREKHRMEAFVRFQCTKDKLYYSIIQPDYNVLPLIKKHFEKRYADQRWLIYDSRRKYGLYYDLEKTKEVLLNFEIDLNNKEALKEVLDNEEELYKTLWQQYFQSINIKARKNLKLHIQHMPKRYWKYLPEKQ